ncbi:UxaA family hydrolase [Acuticoccus sp.]|uniref:UxaA family hydrolase n=1 Tax=Acuticoccus sp. TaxID=1904378 RepID=UPI003B518D8B
MVGAQDNVATLTDDRRAATSLAGGGPVAPGVPYGHKVAIRAIPAGGDVVKYGVVIGRATADIAPGDHVHVHNVAEPA